MADQDFKINIVTLADLSGIKITQQQLDALNNAAQSGNKQAIARLKELTQAQRDADRQAYQAGVGIRTVVAAGTIAAGYKFVASLHEAVANIEKMSQELDKQGAQMVSNAQKFAEMAKFSETNTDVIKIGEGALKSVEAAHKRLLDVSSRELTTWQKIGDIWAAGFRVQGPQAAALEIERAIAAQNDEIERQSAIYDISTAKVAAAKQATETYEETVTRLTDAIAKEQAKQTPEMLEKDTAGYLKAAAAAEQYKKQLDSFKESQKKIAESPDSTKLQKEVSTPSTPINRLQKQLGELQQTGRAGGLTPAEEEARSQAEIKTREELYQKQIAQREADFQKQIQDRDDRFTGRAALPTQQKGESQADLNNKILEALNKLLDLWR